MSIVRVIWTLALPLIVQYCLNTNQLMPLGGYLAVGALIMLLMLRSAPPVTEMQKLVSGFGPMLAGSMSLGIAFVLVGLYLSESGRLALVVPALNNLAFLLVFAGSLVLKKPLVERFARLFHAELTPAEVTYCHRVTWLWVGFFSFNIVVILALSFWGTLTLWTIYTGVLAYALAVTIGLVEYLVRKKKFQRFTDRPHDRLLRKLLGNATGT